MSSGSCPLARRRIGDRRMPLPRTASPWRRSPLRWKLESWSPTLKWKPAVPPTPPPRSIGSSRAAGTSGTFCFVIGADAFREIEAWKDYPRVLDRCDFAVVSRPGMPVSELRRHAAGAGRTDGRDPPRAAHLREATAGRQASILLVDAPTSPVSSTDVRSAIVRGASLEGLLPVVVADYIARHGLYQHTREGHESGKEPHEDTATPPAS